jgi:hypothetical protein
MARKQRRQPRRTNSTTTPIAEQTRPRPMTAPVAQPRPRPVASPAGGVQVPLVPESQEDLGKIYAYVGHDLRRIVVFAVVGFAIIIGASIIF